MTPAEFTSPLSGARVLFTGVTGFVGAETVRRVLDRGAEVHALVRYGGGDRWRMRGVEERIAWHEVDLLDHEALRELMRSIRPEVVYHLATYYAVDSRGVDPGEMTDINVKASLLLLDAAKESDALRLFVHTGSVAEFGDRRTPAEEDGRIDPNSIYGSTKAASVVIVRQHAASDGVPTTVLRPWNMYGPYEKQSRLVPHVVLSLLRGDHVPLTAGEQAKDYAYVGDIAEGFVMAGEHPSAVAGEIVHLGSGVTISMRDLIGEIARHFPRAEALLGWGEVPYRENEMWYQGTRIDKAGELLGWKPQVSLADGIAETVEWYRANRGLYES